MMDFIVSLFAMAEPEMLGAFISLGSSKSKTTQETTQNVSNVDESTNLNIMDSSGYIAGGDQTLTSVDNSVTTTNTNITDGGAFKTVDKGLAGLTSSFDKMTTSFTGGVTDVTELSLNSVDGAVDGAFGAVGNALTSVLDFAGNTVAGGLAASRAEGTEVLRSANEARVQTVRYAAMAAGVIGVAFFATRVWGK